MCSECVTAEHDTAFFPLLDALTDPDRLPSSLPKTPEATYSFALQTASDAGILNPSTRGIVEANLALHAGAPRIEAFYQLFAGLHGATSMGVRGAEGCESWVDWYGEVLCDYDALARVVGHETIEAGSGSGKYGYVLST